MALELGDGVSGELVKPGELTGLMILLPQKCIK